MDRFSLQLSSAGQAVLCVGDQSISTGSISAGSWGQIMAHTTVAAQTASTIKIGLILYIGANGRNSAQKISSVAHTILSTDVARLGGFIGTIQDLKIFSPSSITLLTPGNYLSRIFRI